MLDNNKTSAGRPLHHPPVPSLLPRTLLLGNRMTGSSKAASKGVWIISGLVVLLLILHQDNWNWESDTLVFGFMPIGLFWHACISLGASLTWALATFIAWPFGDDGQAFQENNQQEAGE